MSAVSQAEDIKELKQRSLFRLSMIVHDPVYLLFNVDGIDVDPVVDELGGGGARLVSSKHFEMFHVGQILGPSILVLEDVGMPVVYPLVKWMSWPVVGVEFQNVTEKDRKMIMNFLFMIERKKNQFARPKARKPLSEVVKKFPDRVRGR